MSLTTTYTNQSLVPAHSPHLARTRTARLPYGGPYGTGGVYAKGRALGSVTSTTPQSEVRTIALTGTPTGATGTIVFAAGDRTYTGTLPNLVSTIPTAAEFTTAMEQIFGTGNVTVVKTSLSYACTFAGALANVRIGGLLSASLTFTAGTSPAYTHTRTTVGSCGSGQWDVQLDASSDGTQTPKGFLQRDFYSTPTGGALTDFGSAVQPETPPVFVAGFFNAADLSGLTTTGLALVGRISEGGALTDADAIISVF
jgi:hypothetical protein